MTVFQSGTELPVAACKTVWDTDSNEVYIDNCATASITNDPRDCLIPPQRIQRRIKGIAGVFETDVYTTTIKWDLEDDDGVTETHIIPNSYYIPTAPNRLFSPQHWAQHQKKTSMYDKRARCATYNDAIVLEWDGRRKKKTIPLDIRGSNVGIMRTSPGFQAYSAFCQEVGRSPTQEDTDPVTFQMNWCETPVQDEQDEPVIELTDLDDEHSERYFPLKDKPLKTGFDLNGPEVSGTAPDQEDPSTKQPDSGPSAELLQTHYRYGHAPMSKLQQMARQGILPSRLANCDIPLCTGCLYGKASRKPWRTKQSAREESHEVVLTKPGQCVSVDQLVSTTPGLIAQLQGRPTTKRYMVATIFVDHYSGLSFVNVQKTASAEETVEGKEKFEAYAASCGVHVQHYHADNGIFADNQFCKAIKDAKQTLSFCGVNAHFQNGVAERRIRELQDSARYADPCDS